MIIFLSCNQNNKASTAHEAIPITDAKNISAVSTTLPYALGAETFKTSCTICHSASYINMQPDFTRSAWEKIVDKMKKNFGAPITDSSAKTIVDYLVAVKGKSEL